MKVNFRTQLHIEPTQTHRSFTHRSYRHAEPEREAEAAAAQRDSAQCDSAQRDSAECGGHGAPGAGKTWVLGIVVEYLLEVWNTHMLNLWYIYLHLP